MYRYYRSISRIVISCLALFATSSYSAIVAYSNYNCPSGYSDAAGNCIIYTSSGYSGYSNYYGTNSNYGYYPRYYPGTYYGNYYYGYPNNYYSGYQNYYYRNYPNYYYGSPNRYYSNKKVYYRSNGKYVYPQRYYKGANWYRSPNYYQAQPKGNAYFNQRARSNPNMNWQRQSFKGTPPPHMQRATFKPMKMGAPRGVMSAPRGKPMGGFKGHPHGR